MECPACRGSGELEKKSIGYVISRLRKAEGLTQGQLGKLVNLSRASIANIEGDRQEVSGTKLRLFATILHCKIDDIVPDIKEPTP